MAYVPLASIASGDTIVTTWGNQVKDNFAAGVPDIFTTKGDIAVASGADAAGRLAIGSDFQIAHAKASATLGAEYSSGVFALATSGAQSIPDNAETKVQIASASVDTYSMLDATNFRLTIPAAFPASRYYIVIAYGEFALHATAGKIRQVQVRKNGSVITAQTATQEVGGGLSTRITAVSYPLILSATDYVEMWAFHQAGAGLNISDNSLGLYMIR